MLKWKPILVGMRQTLKKSSLSILYSNIPKSVYIRLKQRKWASNNRIEPSRGQIYATQ